MLLAQGVDYLLPFRLGDFNLAMTLPGAVLIGVKTWRCDAAVSDGIHDSLRRRAKLAQHTPYNAAAFVNRREQPILRAWRLAPRGGGKSVCPAVHVVRPRVARNAF